MTHADATTGRHSAWRVAAPVAAGAIVLSSALWAFAPLEAPALGPAPEMYKEDGASATSPTPYLVALDRSAFRAPLWIAPTPPPAPPAAPAPPPPPPPLKLQLLAIIKEDSDNGVTGYKAMVYDPDSDKVMLVVAGEQLGGRTIEWIDHTALRIVDSQGTRVLTLKTDGGIR